MRWFNDLKISAKLMSSFLVIAVIASMIGFVGVRNLTAVSHTGKVNSDDLLLRIPKLAELAVNFQQVRIHMRNLVLAENKEDMAKYNDAAQALRARASDVVKDYGQGIVNPQIKALYNEYVAARVEYEQLGDQVLTEGKEGRKKEALAILWGPAYGQAVKRMQTATDGLVDGELKLAAERAEEAEGSASAYVLTMEILAAAGICLAMGLAYFISKNISRPVGQLADQAAVVAGGDLTVVIPQLANDEIGQLGGAFKRMIESLRDTIGQVGEASASVAGTASQISSSTEEMAAGAQEQTSQASEVASAVEEMTKTIIENSKNASAAADSARKATVAAEEGVKISREALESIRRNVEIAGQVGTIVNELGASSEKIGDIIVIIDDIADQTNLLALNAAIEAARAGEQGRGFAVVADEVRKLAERTTKATKEIAELIKGIQGLTSNGMSSMDKAAVIVKENREMTEKTAEALNGIVTMSNQVTDMVTQIAAASEEQSSAGEQISKNVEAISAVTRQTASGTEQVALAAGGLNQLTERLQQLVDRFTLGGNQSEQPAQPAKKVPISKTAVRANGKLVAHS